MSGGCPRPAMAYGSLQFVSERDVLCNEQRKHLLHANLFFSFKFYKQICSLRLKFKLRLLAQTEEICKNQLRPLLTVICKQVIRH